MAEWIDEYGYHLCHHQNIAEENGVYNASVGNWGSLPPVNNSAVNKVLDWRIDDFNNHTVRWFDATWEYTIEETKFVTTTDELYFGLVCHKNGHPLGYFDWESELVSEAAELVDDLANVAQETPLPSRGGMNCDSFYRMHMAR